MPAQRFTLNRSEMETIDFTQEACDVSDAVYEALAAKYAPIDYQEALDFDENLWEATERITLGNLS